MSKKGTSSFILQRASAVVLAPLSIWFLFEIVSALTADYAAARAWLSAPLNAALLGGFFIIGALHMRIGLAEIIVDYVHSWAKDVLLFINWLAALGLIAVAGWSIYTISFAG
ncbi:MAG: succinate dehydrogenase, hydrophobic membrane anchor protein [Alphaproteobacteria bacterium]|nr:succinate dehydrogenase, hydrophobic membrane anchor protein [Alphaproteobacteria bacterium]